MQPYHARRTFVYWLEEAGVSRSRRKAYMDDGLDISGLYEAHEVEHYLTTDAARIHTWLLRQLEK